MKRISHDLSRLGIVISIFLVSCAGVPNDSESSDTVEHIKSALLKARGILLTENGALWGEQIWTDNILIIDFDNHIYSLKPLADSNTNDNILYCKQIQENELILGNTIQTYDGEEYATILTSYLDDGSNTMIHELFHILQSRHRTYEGDGVPYLDNYDAREWLRLEYQALRNALEGIRQDKSDEYIERYIYDALVFRKARQTKYHESLDKELDLETLEGLACYTGLVLSTDPDKYAAAISEINKRELSPTYTRAFPYATGPAYGLLFDYLDIDWKKGLDVIYDFLSIYEGNYLRGTIETDTSRIREAERRNNYDGIHAEELEQQNRTEEILEYYTEKFIQNPTLTAELTTQEGYVGSFDMYGTMTLEDYGTVYSMIACRDESGENFGDFSTRDGEEQLGISGVLVSSDWMKYTFPLPIEIRGNLIIGDHYSIEMNEGWDVIRVNDAGDMKIIKREN